LSDRHGRRRVLLPAVGFVGLMTGAMGLAQGFLSMFVIRDLLGVGDGVGWSVGQATINEESAPSRRGINQAIFTLGYTLIGVGVGGIIITRMTSWFGWRAVFPIIGLVTLLICAALSILMREPAIREEKPADWRSAVGLLRNPSLVFITIAGCAVLSWLQIIVGFNVLYLTKIRAFSLTDAGLVASFWGFAGAAGQILVPLASDHLGRRPVVCASALVSAVTLTVYLLGDQGFWPMLGLAMLCGFCGFGLLPVVLATCVSETVSDEIRGAALGMTNFFGVIVGTTLMPLIGGVLVDTFSLTATLAIAVVAQLVVAAAILMIKETAPRIVARNAGSATAPA